LTGAFGVANTYTAPNLTISGASNSYTGEWDVMDGFLYGSATGSLGAGNNIVLANNSILETGYTLNDTTGSLTMNGATAELDLNQNWTFSAMSFNGTLLANGTYNEAQLETALGMTNANFTDAGVDAGGNTITVGVVPEPGTWAMVLGGAALLIGLQEQARRRRQM
jgi:hypothetical protein